MKFLIIRFSSIGDIVLTTPVIRCLKKQLVTSEVHFLTKHSFRYLVDSNPFIDKIHYLQHNLDQLTEELIEEDFDYVIDLHHNLRSLKIKRALGKRSFSFHKLNIEKWIYTNFGFNFMPRLHIVDRYLATIKEFGIKNDGQGLDFFISEKDKVKESDIPASHHAGYIAIVIGAAHNTKKLPLHKLKKLCSDINHPIILIGGKTDFQQGEMICEDDNIKVYNACGKFTINESADLVRRAKLVISHDTGYMHIAAAFNRPVISVWGNTVPEFGMYPYYGTKQLSVGTPPYDIFEITGLNCRPCSKIGFNKCPEGHFKCMELITTEAIVQRTNERLGKI